MKIHFLETNRIILGQKENLELVVWLRIQPESNSTTASTLVLFNGNEHVDGLGSRINHCWTREIQQHSGPAETAELVICRCCVRIQSCFDDDRGEAHEQQEAFLFSGRAKIVVGGPYRILSQFEASVVTIIL
jgi:hypothetical protein